MAPSRPRKKAKTESKVKSPLKNVGQEHPINDIISKAGSWGDSNNNNTENIKEEDSSNTSLFGIQNPLMNSVVLWNMFAFMGPDELKQCRLVSKTWTFIASRFLAQRSQVLLHVGKPRLSWGWNIKQTEPLLKFQTCIDPTFISNPKGRGKNKKLKSKGTEKEDGPLNFISFMHFYVLNFQFTELSKDILFICCGKFMTSLHLDQISEHDCNSLITNVYHSMRSLKELVIICTDEYLQPSNTEIDEQIIPEDNPVPLNLTCLSFTSKYDNYESTFNWELFSKLCPKLETLELRLSIAPLCSALENHRLNHKGHSLIRKLIISLENDDFVSGVNLDRSGLSNHLKNFIPLTRIEELIIDANLTGPQWKDILYEVPSSLKRLSLSSDWCLGTWYPENEINQPDSQSSLNYFISCLQNCQNLNELVMYIHAGKIESKRVKMVTCNFVFPTITSLSWVFQRKYSWSWQTACPKFFSNTPKIFPNLVRFESTVDSKRSFRELITHLPNIEELIISQFSKYKIQDLDLIGDVTNNDDNNNGDGEGSTTAAKRRHKKSSYLGIFNLKKLRCLRLESNCFKLTDVSIFRGFLEHDELSELEIFHAPDFGAEAMSALLNKLKNLTLTSGRPPHPC